jgi:hypothetical protein
VLSPWNLCLKNYGEDFDVLIYLWTRTDSFELRKKIRQTWSNRTLFPTVNLAFVLGLSNDRSTNSRIRGEHEMYGDIIQGDRIDVYRNLSFKPYVQWRWTIYNCMNAKYFAKQDDDTFLNTPKFLEFIQNRTAFNPVRPSCAGEIRYNEPVDRRTTGRFATKLAEWPEPDSLQAIRQWAFLFNHFL